MNDIIKAIEDAQLKAEVADFRVGDTVKVYAKLLRAQESVSRYSRVQYLKDRTVEQERHLQLESSLTCRCREDLACSLTNH